MDLDDGGVATVMLLNPTGGLLGGDVLRTSVAVGPRSRVCLTTPAASRVYRSLGAPAVHEFTACVERDASLEYMPDHLIPSPGARLRQRTEVTLDADGTFIGLDAWSVGRIARGERWLFDELDMSFVVRDARGLLLGERARLAGARPLQGLGGTEGSDYLATFAAIAPSRTDWGELADEWLGAMQWQHPQARCGVTLLARGGLLARILCEAAPALHRAVHTLWGVTRLRLLGLTAINLRKL